MPRRSGGFAAVNIVSMLSETDQSGGRVLVVEDDADIADVLRRSLRNEGYEVRTSADGVEALDVAAGFVPDLVVLDLGLPGIDGVEVCRRLRERRRRADPDADRPRRDRGPGRPASTAAPTTTWSSPSSARSCWRGSGRCCAAARRAAPPRSRSATSPSTPTRARCAAASGRSS